MAGPRVKHRVSYFHDPEAGQFYLGPSHPMKPHRVQLAHQIILGYELHNKMICYVGASVTYRSDEELFPAFQNISTSHISIFISLE
jgi:hypothetical protein